MDPDDAESLLLLIPLMWATKMFSANIQFLAEMETLPIEDLLETLRSRVGPTKGTH